MKPKINTIAMNYSSKKKILPTKKSKQIQNNKNIINYYNDKELNNLNYKIALEIDKRKYWEYYWSLLKTKHIIIFTFMNGKDYNVFLIKLSLFIFSFSLYFTVNAFFLYNFSNLNFQFLKLKFRFLFVHYVLFDHHKI